MTGIEVTAQSLEDFKKPETMQNIRNRSAMLLRCTSCRGDCPICGAACCIYENARRAAALANPSSETARKSKVILHIIEGLGPHIRNVGAFSLCSEWYGCGRYVCPNCAGVCPNGICRDVQCKVLHTPVRSTLWLVRVAFTGIEVLTLSVLGMQTRPLVSMRLVQRRLTHEGQSH